MNILVTGGAGFIGSHIAEAYLQKGHHVTVVDNMSHGFTKNIVPGVKLYKADIREFNTINRIVKQVKPDVINHHAAIAAVTNSVSNPTETFDVNVNGTINLLISAAQYNVKRFVFASTGGAMYGDGVKLPVSETTAAAPESPYGLSKQLAEQAVEYYSRMHKLKHVIFRYGNVYGLRQDPKGEAGVVAIFHNLLAAGQAPTIFGNGSKTRDYVYVEDVVRANILALTKGTGETMNIGTGKQTSDAQVYGELAGYFDKAAPARYAKVRPGELLHSALQASKAKRVMKWSPQYSFAEGIEDYITKKRS